MVRSAAMKRKTFLMILPCLGCTILMSNLVFLGNDMRKRKTRDIAAQEVLAGYSTTSSFENTTMQTQTTIKVLEMCPKRPQTLLGAVSIIKCTDMNVAVANNPEVKMGGEWFPTDCKSLQKLAIIISYRDREAHLVQLLDHLHPFLQKQKRHYKIFVVEQVGTDYFNKGALYNTGFMYANSTFKMDCASFHDVDLIPIDDRNSYECSQNPRHLSAAIDVFNYSVFYDSLIGGVLNMRPAHIVKVNGYSNLFWGWGAEDDDMWSRLKHHRMRVDRPPTKIAKFNMLKHTSRKKLEKGWGFRYLLLNNQRRVDRSKIDGLSTLATKVVSVSEHKLYTHIMVNVGKQPSTREIRTKFLMRKTRPGRGNRRRRVNISVKKRPRKLQNTPSINATKHQTVP